MDEIVFRCGQKLETLQIQLNLMKEGSISLASDLWHSQRMVQFQELTKEFLEWVLEIAERAQVALVTVIVPGNFIGGLVGLLQNEVNRRHLFYGCLGFVVGYSIATCMQKPPVYMRAMQGAVCPSYNGIECATLLDDIPAPRVEQPDELLIQVKASSVSAADANICHGYGKRLRRLLCKYNHSLKTEFPIILGRSCSGIVVEIGRNVTRFEVGDEVYTTSPVWAQGTIAEFVVTSEARTGPKPKRIGFEGAAALPYAGCMALNAMGKVGLQEGHAEGKRVLICNACSPSGCVLVQYCVLLGMDVTATVHDPKIIPVTRKLGARDVILTQNNSDSHKQFTKELELRDKYDVIFITNTPNISIYKSMLYQFCTEKQWIISVDDQPDQYNFILGLFVSVYIRCKCFVLNRFHDRMDFRKLEVLTDLVDRRRLESVVDKVFQPYDIEAALEHVQSVDSIGSAVITFR